MRLLDLADKTLLPMATTTFSLELARKSILEEGFFDPKDSEVVEYILEMAQRDFPFFSEYGLDFCKQHVLDDSVPMG